MFFMVFILFTFSTSISRMVNSNFSPEGRMVVLVPVSWSMGSM